MSAPLSDGARALAAALERDGGAPVPIPVPAALSRRERARVVLDAAEIVAEVRAAGWALSVDLLTREELERDDLALVVVVAGERRRGEHAPGSLALELEELVRVHADMLRRHGATLLALPAPEHELVREVSSSEYVRQRRIFLGAVPRLVARLRAQFPALRVEHRTGVEVHEPHVADVWLLRTESGNDA